MTHIYNKGSWSVRIRPQTEKVEQIKDAPCPTTKVKFIHFFDKCCIVGSLFQTLHLWVDTRAWKGFSEAILKETVLKLSNCSLPFYLQTNASAYGIGAAFLGMHKDIKHPVAFFSFLNTSIFFSDWKRVFSPCVRNSQISNVFVQRLVLPPDRSPIVGFHR